MRRRHTAPHVPSALATLSPARALKPTKSWPSAPLLLCWPASSSADLAGGCTPVGVLVQQVNRALVRVVAGHDGQRQRSPRLGLQRQVAEGLGTGGCRGGGIAQQAAAVGKVRFCPPWQSTLFSGSPPVPGYSSHTAPGSTCRWRSPQAAPPDGRAGQAHAVRSVWVSGWLAGQQVGIGLAGHTSFARWSREAIKSSNCFTMLSHSSPLGVQPSTHLDAAVAQPLPQPARHQHKRGLACM